MKNNIPKKIVAKVFLIVSIVLIYAIFIIFFNRNEYNKMYNEMLTDSRNEYQMFLDKYIYYIKNDHIQKSYNMLSEECKKTIFDDNIYNYEEFISSEIVNKSDIIEYDLIKIFNNTNNNLVYSIIVQIRDKEYNLQMIAYSPFDYKIYWNLD